MKRKDKIDTSGAGGFGQNPFGDLGGSLGDLPQGPAKETARKDAPKQKAPKARLEVRREKAGRGGKTVTLVRPLNERLPGNVLDELVGMLKQRLATGGRVSSGQIEVQGDHVQTVVQLLTDSGWNAFAGN